MTVRRIVVRVLGLAALSCSGNSAAGGGHNGAGGAMHASSSGPSSGSSASGSQALVDASSISMGAIPTGPGASNAGHRCDKDEDCGAGGVCDPSGHSCGCGGVVVSANGVPPNLLLVEDRSCSMTGKVNGQTKWGIAVKAVQDLTTSYQGRIRFGLELFPDRGGNKCTEDQIQIPTGPSNEATIQSLLNSALDKADANFPSGPCVTPIDAAMQMAETDPALSDASRTSYVLLITDGEQAGCSAGGGDANTIQAITDLAARGVHTFVVGFGAAVSIPSLESFAVAGGEVNAKGPHKFYEAQDAASLGAALTIIGQQTLGCDLSLADPPPNGDVRLVFVYFNHAAPPIMRDPSHQSGWDYDPAVNQVHFYGQECDALRSGQSQSASVVFGCGGTLVPPPPPF